MITQEDVTHYFEGLGHLYRSLEVNNQEGISLNFATGIDQVMNLALKTHESGHKLMFIGNGGSAGITSHMAIDYWKNGGIRSMAFNDASLLTCLGNDYGYEHVFAKPIEMHAQPEDLLIAISSSGKSANILNGVKAAREAKCHVVTLSGFSPDNPLRRLGDVNFYVPSQAYGYVEITHLAVCHSILDMACELKKK